MSSIGKRDFGSFFSSNVEELIYQPTSDYTPPPIPVELPTFHEKVSFGAQMKEKHFLLDNTWTFINHGAFGAVLKESLAAAQDWQKYCEKQPLKFLDRELIPLLVMVTRRMASFIDCSPQELVLVPNASTAISTVVQEIARSLSPGDSILILNTTYGATKKLLHHMNLTYGIDIVEIKLEFPITTEEIMKIISDGLKQSTKLAIFDHIPSNYGLIFPIKELIKVCHQRNVEVLVDGAHVLGSQPLSLSDLDADYYVTNAHKWFCSPKGCALLFVKKIHQAKIRSMVVSHGFGKGFSSEFSWTGLRDYSPFLALLTVLDFWEHYGVINIRSYIQTTAKAAAELLRKSWDTDFLCDINLFGAMVLVRLPDQVVDIKESNTLTYNDAEKIQDLLHHKFRIEVPVKVIQGKLFVRISVHAYNEMKDYQHLADAVSQIIIDKRK